MKKVLMLLCLVFALFGCEKDEGAQQEWIECTGKWSSSSLLWIDDPSISCRHPLINNLSDYTELKIKEGMILIYNPIENREPTGIRILCYPSLREEAVKLLGEISDYPSPVNPFYSDKNVDFDWFGGVKNGKAWIGKVDRKTRKVIQEWTDGKDVEQDLKVDLGYGNYRTIHVDRLRVWKLQIDDYSIVASNAYNSKNYIGEGSTDFVPYSLYVLSDNKMVSIPLKHTSESRIEVIPWYKNSLLISQGKGCTCYTLEGELIDSYKTSVSSYDKTFPCSYSDYINISGGRISRETLKDSPNDIWNTSYDPLSQIPSNAKVTYTLLSSSTNIWEFKVDVLNYDGSRKSFKFKVDIETGEVTD